MNDKIVCPRCEKVVSKARLNRHVSRRCGVLSVKRFLRLYPWYVKGARLHKRDEEFVKNFMRSKGPNELVRIMEKALRRQVQRHIIVGSPGIIGIPLNKMEHSR